eukprot:scaffold2079_cov77-Skeletonema_dohrnii-CCMP3373.AAC.2
MRGRKLKKELFSYCNSDSLSEEGLREIIERHGLTTQNLSSFRLGRFRFFHAACINDRVNEGIIQCLLEYFPVAASAANLYGQLPLYNACRNRNVTLNIIQLLIDASPASVRCQDNYGRMPLHHLCDNKQLDEAAALEILKLLIEKCPETVRHADNGGYLPIHHASLSRCPEFCRALIEEYPGSERMIDTNGILPLYYACRYNTLATVEYLYKHYPDAINHATTRGVYPIHASIMAVDHSDNPLAAVDIVKYLLGCDPNVKLQKIGRKSLLHCACRQSYNYNDSYIEAALEIIEEIYDAHPEAIEENRIASDIQRYHQQVQSLINSQLVYARQAKDLHVMTTPDSNGRLPLHTALQINNVALGSIKLLVKGNPHALQTPDHSGTLPLHVACQHQNSSNIVQYLIGLDTTALDAVDKEGDTALHYACLGAKYETIALLLERYGAISVSKQNAYGNLPIDLLWESNEVEDRGSVEYTESVFRLLAAYPETLMNICM